MLKRVLLVLSACLGLLFVSTVPANAVWDGGSKAPQGTQSVERGSFVIGERVDGSTFVEGQIPDTLQYPANGPYMSARWHDAYHGYTVLGIPTHDGHPYVCFESDNGVEARHRIGTAAGFMDTYEFIVEFSYTGCASVGTRYKVLTAKGLRTDTCTHTYVTYESSGGVSYITRMIVYFDEDLWYTCSWDDAWTNDYRTSRAVATALGLKTHHGDGAPSIMSYSNAGISPYRWPTQYDTNTLAWWNR